MESQQLFLADGKAIKPHLCGKCNRIWESRDSADRCCTCSYCGEHVSWDGGSTTHGKCQLAHYAKADAEALAKAKLVPDYGGPFLMGDRCFGDAKDLLDWYTDDELPGEAFCCKPDAPRIDVDAWIENLDMGEDWEPIGYEELEQAVAKWNTANADNVTWYEDRSRKWSKAELLARNPEAKA